MGVAPPSFNNRGHHTPFVFVPSWKYEIGDRVMSPTWAGLIEHHMRVTNRIVDLNGERWYLIFDTSWSRGYADYEWHKADELELNSSLVERPHSLLVPTILQRIELCRGLLYSIPHRADCESLQNWIGSGDERLRWSPQVWKAVGKTVEAVLKVYIETQQQQTYSKKRQLNASRRRVVATRKP